MPLLERLACVLFFLVLGWEDGPAILRWSVEIAGFQGRISLVDDLQLLLGFLVAAMGVRVVLLDQHLVARLQTHRGERRFEIEHREGLRARRGNPSRGLAGPATGLTIRMAPGMTVGAAPVAVVLLAAVEPERVA